MHFNKIQIPSSHDPRNWGPTLLTCKIFASAHFSGKKNYELKKYAHVPVQSTEAFRVRSVGAMEQFQGFSWWHQNNPDFYSFLLLRVEKSIHWTLQDHMSNLCELFIHHIGLLLCNKTNEVSLVLWAAPPFLIPSSCVNNTLTLQPTPVLLPSVRCMLCVQVQ